MVLIKFTKEIHGPTLQYPVADLEEGATGAPLKLDRLCSFRPPPFL